MTDPTGFVIDDETAYEPLRALGWDVDAVPWSRPRVAWNEYDLVVIRSSWDYQHRVDAFLAVLAEIVDAGTRLENGIGLVRWNLRKTYLRDLERRGLSTVPTLWRDRLAPGELEGLFGDLGCDEAVVKPIVSANADGAYRLDATVIRERASEVELSFSDRGLLAQPFVRSVLEEGEYSLCYFNGEHSHTVLKTPKRGDFRVQEEHGGVIQAVTAEPALCDAGRAALCALDETPLYARADFVRSNDGNAFWLMELELIEPALYLRMDAGAPERFARALNGRMARQSTG